MHSFPFLCHSVGNTALTYACCGGGGYEEVVRILLDAGADVEHQNDNGHTPLMEAASCGHVGESSPWGGWLWFPWRSLSLESLQLPLRLVAWELPGMVLKSRAWLVPR